MKIDVAHTPYSEIAEIDKYNLLSEKNQRELADAAVKIYGSHWSMTIDDLAALLSGDFSRLGDMSDPTILQVFWVKGFKKFMDDFTKALESLTIPMTADERRASEGLPPVSFIEGLLIFAKNYFRHHSFEQAGKTILSGILIAKKDTYRSQMQNRRWQAIQQEKIKHTNGKHHS